jgi:hypothetical protein
MADRRPFLSGFCNPSNPQEIHDRCRGSYAGLVCTCTHHHTEEPTVPESSYPCGHATITSVCGGCDPAAIDFVITDDGVQRPFDPDRDMARPQFTNPIAVVEVVAKRQAARMYRGGTWDQLPETDRRSVRALVSPIVADVLEVTAS